MRGENFRSFENFDLDLNTQGLIAVVGENGAGKSTIFGAVEWALYGNQHGRGAMSQLLGTVTQGRYSAIRISEKYAVEGFDGRVGPPA